MTLWLSQRTSRNLEHPNDKIERSLLKIAAWTIGIIVFLVAGGILGHRSFRNWQQRRLIAQANALVNEGDLKRASLDARRVLQINPESVEACRVLARLAKRAGLRAELDWRRRVMDLGAANPEDLVALARAAVRYDDRGTADVAIGKLPGSAKSTAEYHALMADIATAQRDGLETDRQLTDALRIDPANKEYAMRLAALQSTANDRSIRNKGREALIALQNNSTLRQEATRHLVEQAIRASDYTDAVAFARKLDSYPETNFSDRIVLLTALQVAKDPAFSALFDELKRSAAEDPQRAAALISWMNGRGMPSDAIAWSGKLPTTITGARFVRTALSDSYIAVGDWAGLQRLVKIGNWENLEFLRSALAARGARELGSESESAAYWAEASKKAATDQRHLMQLVETAQRWGWRGEAIDLLWIAAKDAVKGDEALRTLYTYFAKNGDTQNLYRVLLHRAELLPNDRNVQNNLAQVSLLLNLNVDRANKIARDVYAKEPGNPAYASTYAFSLYTKGDNKNALKILDGLTDSQRRQPDVAAYYGMILAASGDHVRAAEYLDLGEKASFLPEEKTLLERARRSLAQR